jgi:peptide/nickel transport system ATP-binding protein
MNIKNIEMSFAGNGIFFNRKKNTKKALENINAEVYPGETLGIVGESGSGKTTLGRIILGLIKPTSGNVFYRNINLTTLSESKFRKWRPKIQIIFQDPNSSLNPSMHVGESLMEPLRVHKIYSGEKERLQKVMELLELVELPVTAFHKYPHELSGGQKQRICIARALALKPEIIVCDESLASLDVSIQAQVLNLLTDLRNKFGFTFLFISHDIAVVRYFCDRIIVMHSGKIVETGESDKIYFYPEMDYTKQLIDSVPKGRIEDIKKALQRRKELANVA